MIVQRILIISSGLLALTALVACHPKPFQPLDNDGTQLLPSHVDGAYDSAIIAMQKKFRTQGLGMVTIGQNYMVSIPSSYLFADQSPRILWPSYALLNDVVFYLQQFRKVSIHITAYSSQYRSVKREHALTLARARAVGDYLWSQGVDSRFIFTEGAGSDKPIASFRQGGDHEPSSRIEITFRRAVA